MAAPVAIKELVNDPDTGALRVELRDAQTGAKLELAEAVSYNIAALNSFGGLVPVNEGITPSEENSPVYAPIRSVDIPRKPILDDIREPSRADVGVASKANSPRQASDNFGYIDKPGIMGAANMLPGALGMASRVANGIVNNNNAMAVSSARQSIGLNPLGTAQLAKQTLSDNRGQVGDVAIGDNTYSVGLEASTPKGRTNLTPNEARNRALTSGLGIRDATPEESKVNNAANPVKSPSILGGMIEKGKGLLGIEKASPLANTSVPARVDYSTPTKVSPQVASPINTVEKASPISTTTASKPMPSYSEATRMAPSSPNRTSIPSVPASQLGKVSTDLEDRAPGLAGIARTPNISIDSKSIEGLKPGIVNALGAVTDVHPGATMISGVRSAQHNAAVRGASKSKHLSGDAVDIDTSTWSDAEKTAALEAAGSANIKGIGIYDKGRSIHIDTRDSFTTWGANPKNKFAGVPIDKQPGWAQKTLTDIRDAGPYSLKPLNGPTPKARPTPTAVDIGISEPDKPTKTPKTGLASLANRDMINSGISLDKKQQQRLSETIAGELSGNTLRGLARQDPKAIAEAAQVTQVAANRIASVGFDKAITPSQFNSIGRKAMDTTKNNYSKYGGLVSDVVGKTLSGELSAPRPENNHYSNQSIAKDKSWEKDLTEVNKINEHTFGTVQSRFNASPASKKQENAKRAAVANASEFSGISRAEQKADRQVSDTSKTPSKGLGSKPASSSSSNTKSSKSSVGMGGGKTRSTSAGLASKSSSNNSKSSNNNNSKSGPSKSDSKGSKSSSGSKSGGGKSSSKK